MRRLLMVCLLLAGCNKEPVPTVPAPTQPIATKAKKTSYTPSELVNMETLPEGEILIVGKVKISDKDMSSDGRLWVQIEDDVIKSINDEDHVSVRFEENGNKFSSGLLKWFAESYAGKPARIKAKVQRIGIEKEVFAIGIEIQ